MAKPTLCDDMNCVHYHINDPIPAGILSHEEMNIFMILFHKIHSALEKNYTQERNPSFRGEPRKSVKVREKGRKRNSFSDLQSHTPQFTEGIDYIKPKKKMDWSAFDENVSTKDNFFEQGMVLEKKPYKHKRNHSKSTFRDERKIEDNLSLRTDFMTLTSWSLVELPHEQCVAVEGFILDTEDKVIRSEAIIRRCKRSEIGYRFGFDDKSETNIIESAGGAFYKLTGQIDENETLKAGFSPALIDAFKRGFPVNWKTHIEEHFIMRKKWN
ncbi:DgyrCDS401 [Dimorphilus gyrociliatus]|uniref:DgyrCDS401 n=1 Tax=Dimorphilus gyrociliatus TaxID=2664684 RepID=A0A7I8V600_9ANNE|nr:DgyrCDS401 [Dimorphilus gyrociliatus]